MMQLGIRGVLAWAFTAFLLAGCGGTTTEDQPIEPPPEPADTQPPAPIEQAQPEAREVDAMGNPLDPESGEPLSRVFYFEFDQAVLSPADLAALEQHARFLTSHPDRRVVIEGHADERGTREYNLALGERRAEVVRTFLLTSGVSRSQVDVVSYGEERPADPGHSESAWAKNRRAVLVYR